MTLGILVLGGIMMKAQEYWKQFELTGDIRDYLNYTACTSEGIREWRPNTMADRLGEMRERKKEHDRLYQSDRDRFSNHTDW